MFEKILKCNSISEALEATGLTYHELYKLLKSKGLDMQFPGTWFSQIKERDGGESVFEDIR